MMSSHNGKTPRDDGRREQRIRALGAVLNALVSQSRALTAQAAATFHTDLQPAAFHIARSAASRLTRELVRLGLVATSTDPADRRSTVLSLTVDGRRRMEAAMQAKGATFRHRVASWSEEDLLLCTDLLQRLLDMPANAGVEP